MAEHGHEAMEVEEVPGGEMDVDLIPGLPEDIALECLLRVSYKCHPQLLGVCRKWEQLVNRPQFYEERRRASTTSHCVCLIQALPAAAQSSKGGEKQVAAPVYAVTVHDLKAGTWERLPPIPDFPQGMPLFCQSVAFEGSLFILGGWDPATWEAMKCVYMFNFSAGAWTRCADMLTVRSFFACGAHQGAIYVAGGHDDSKNALTSAEVYRIGEDRWEVLPHLSEERDECTGHFLDGKFHVISGYATESQGQFGRSADVYDPELGCWQRIEDLWSLGTCPSSSVVAAGHLYAFHRQHMFRYLPATNSWVRMDGVPEGGRVAPRATAVQGCVFLTGSVNGGGRCLMYKPPKQMAGEGEWVSLETDEAFAGLTVSSSTVEV